MRNNKFYISRKFSSVMALFKQPMGTPLQLVLQMRQQGIADHQIVQSLQKQGYNTQQIFDAVSQADVGAIPAGALPPEPGQEFEQPYPEQYAAPQGPGSIAQPGQEYRRQEASPSVDLRINEVAEAIINEKWEEVFGEIQKVISWKEKVETEMQKIKDDIASIKEEFNQVRLGILGKIGEYDEHMRDVGSEVKAVHKVFQDVIPQFTENVAEISRVAKSLKGKKKE